MGKNNKKKSKGPANRAKNGNPAPKAEKPVVAKPKAEAKAAAKPASRPAEKKAEAKAAAKAPAKEGSFLDGITASIKKLIHSH